MAKKKGAMTYDFMELQMRLWVQVDLLVEQIFSRRLREM